MSKQEIIKADKPAIAATCNELNYSDNYRFEVNFDADTEVSYIALVDTEDDSELFRVDPISILEEMHNASEESRRYDLYYIAEQAKLDK